MAQGVLQDLVEKEQLLDLLDRIDSAGTGAYHVGSEADPRTLWTLTEHNIHLNHAARQLCKSDFMEFDYILAMDRQNLADIQSKAPKNSKATINLFGDFLSQKTSKKIDKIIKDPYYGHDNSGFARAFEQCQLFSAGLIEHIKHNQQ